MERFAKGMRAWLALLLFAASLYACATHVPELAAPPHDVSHSFEGRRKIPLRVGVYLNEDMHSCPIRQDLMGVLVELDLGKCIAPMAMQIARAMCRDAVIVDLLPPYHGNNSPEVDAVMEPELLYYHSAAESGFRGPIETTVGMRVKIYDLGGSAIWAEEALGIHSTGQIDLIDTLLIHSGKLGEAAYMAASDAATTIIHRFYEANPKELKALSEAEPPKPSVKNIKSSQKADLFEPLYNTALSRIQEKNYQRAVAALLEAERIDPTDPYTRFYLGVCYAYLWRKQDALASFNEALQKSRVRKLTQDCKEWIAALNEPLKIALVYSRGYKSPFISEAYAVIPQALSSSGMYDVLQTNFAEPDLPKDKNRFSNFLDKSLAKGIRVAIFIEFEGASEMVQLPGTSNNGNTASQLSLRLKARAYSTRKKTSLAEFTLAENTVLLAERTVIEEASTYKKLLKRASDKLVSKLLESNIL